MLTALSWASISPCLACAASSGKNKGLRDIKTKSICQTNSATPTTMSDIIRRAWVGARCGISFWKIARAIVCTHGGYIILESHRLGKVRISK